jgi:hypothetical protein
MRSGWLDRNGRYVALGILGTLVPVLVLLQGYQGRVALVQSSRQACERGKLDRADNAAGWTAHRRYIEHVTAAVSVKEDVKSAAREANRTYSRISRSLTVRARLDCRRAIPPARLLPG